MVFEMGFLLFSNICLLYLDFKDIVLISKQGVELPKIWLNNCSERGQTPIETWRQT